jgi:hypothetical protein
MAGRKKRLKKVKLKKPYVKLVQEILLYNLDDSVNVRCVDIDPINFKITLGDDQPSISTYDFKSTSEQSVII